MIGSYAYFRKSCRTSGTRQVQWLYLARGPHLLRHSAISGFVVFLDRTFSGHKLTTPSTLPLLFRGHLFSKPESTFFRADHLDGGCLLSATQERFQKHASLPDDFFGDLQFIGDLLTPCTWIIHGSPRMLLFFWEPAELEISNVKSDGGDVENFGSPDLWAHNCADALLGKPRFRETAQTAEYYDRSDSTFDANNLRLTLLQRDGVEFVIPFLHWITWIPT